MKTITRRLELSARIESTNPSHAAIGVLQNGGKAGVLCVDLEHAETIVRMLNNAVRLFVIEEAAAERERLEAGRKTNDV